MLIPQPRNPRSLKDIKAKAEFKNDKAFFDAAVTPSSVTASSVFGYGKYLFGASGTFNVAKGALSSTKVGCCTFALLDRAHAHTTHPHTYTHTHTHTHTHTPLPPLQVTVGYTEADLVVTTSIANGSDVEGSIYHVPKPDVQAGVKFSWNKNSKETGVSRGVH